MFNRKHNEIKRLKNLLANKTPQGADLSWTRKLHKVDKIKVQFDPNLFAWYKVTVWMDGKKAVDRTDYDKLLWAIRNCIEKIEKYDTIHADVEIVK